MHGISLPSPISYGCKPNADGTYQATVWIGQNFERPDDFAWASARSFPTSLEAKCAARDYLRTIEQAGGPGFRQGVLRFRPLPNQVQALASLQSVGMQALDRERCNDPQCCRSENQAFAQTHLGSGAKAAGTAGTRGQLPASPHRCSLLAVPG